MSKAAQFLERLRQTFSDEEIDIFLQARDGGRSGERRKVVDYLWKTATDCHRREEWQRARALREAARHIEEGAHVANPAPPAPLPVVEAENHEGVRIIAGE